MLAKLVKELRELTGAGFLDCKKALEASKNDIKLAMEWLKEKGMAKVAKKVGSIASEGIVKVATNEAYAVIYELNSQTDFVAQNSDFQALASKIESLLLENEFTTIEEARKIKSGTETIEQLIMALSAKIGEKINLRRAKKFAIDNKTIGAYTHVNNRVAAIVFAKGGTTTIVRNVAMHVASMNPQFLDENSIPNEKLAKLKAEIMSSPVIENKQEQVKNNIAKGMLRKKLSELTLVDQEFVMEKLPVSSYLKQNGARAVAMIRYELGEGIEKAASNFANEVAKQMKL